MKAMILKIATTSACLFATAPAFADLLYQTGVQQNGTGLGAVNTIVTVQDNGNGQSNGIESGCVTHTAGVFTLPRTVSSVVCAASRAVTPTRPASWRSVFTRISG